VGRPTIEAQKVLIPRDRGYRDRGYLRDNGKSRRSDNSFQAFNFGEADRHELEAILSRYDTAETEQIRSLMTSSNGV
jgi:hypothetical protein